MNASEARDAIDGDRRTGWTGGPTTGSGGFLAIDLGRLAQDLPDPAHAGLRYPGIARRRARWLRRRPGLATPWADHMGRSALLDGSELLRNGQDRRVLAFPLARLRHLRVRPAPGGPAGAWVVDEIDLFE